MLSDGKANHGAVTVVYVDPHGLLFFAGPALCRPWLR